MGTSAGEKCTCIMAEYLYRRNLPHWREDDVVYFVTWRLSAGLAELAPEEREVVVDTLRHFDRIRYELAAYVVMNDHVHVLVRANAGHALKELVHSWKSFSANRLQRRHFSSTPASTSLATREPHSHRTSCLIIIACSFRFISLIAASVLSIGQIVTLEAQPDHHKQEIQKIKKGLDERGVRAVTKNTGYKRTEKRPFIQKPGGIPDRL